MVLVRFMVVIAFVLVAAVVVFTLVVLGRRVRRADLMVCGAGRLAGAAEQALRDVQRDPDCTPALSSRIDLTLSDIATERERSS